MTVFKVKVIEDYINEFEAHLNDKSIYYRKYPEPIVNTYRVECSLINIVDIGHYFSSLESMPLVTLSEDTET